LTINEKRAALEHYDIYETDNFHIYTAGATLLGRDIKSILVGNNETIDVFIQILEEELKLEVESSLLNQIIETHSKIKFDVASEILYLLLIELKKQS